MAISDKRARKILMAVLAISLVSAALLVSKENAVFAVLESTALIGKQKGDFYLLATNQLLRTWQHQWTLRGHPV